MSASAMEGTRQAELVEMAVPLLKTAAERTVRTGPGAPPTYLDWQIAALIMVAVMHRRKSKCAQYCFLKERKQQWIESLGMVSFPSRTTYFERYRRAFKVFECGVALQGYEMIDAGIASGETVSVDKSLIAALGPVQHSRHGKRRRAVAGVDREAGWGYTEHRGWVYGYSYEVVVSANCNGWTVPLAVSTGQGNTSETKSFAPKVELLPKRTRYVLADAGYDTNANGELIEYDSNGQRTGRRFVCPLIPRAGKPRVGQQRRRGRREKLRQRRATRLEFYDSPFGRMKYARRMKTVEPYNDWFKRDFDLIRQVWHRGVDNNKTQISAATFIYQLLVRYQHRRGAKHANIQWILDAL